jgi:antitoxin component YwqK of YwqJK toxin-antitoxin module
MKQLLIIGLLVASATSLQAQVIDDENGKTFYYYDSLTNKKVKEIFHHIVEYKVMWDVNGNERDTVLHIKNGPYTRYHQNGKLACSGFYNKNLKTGIWKHYNELGKMIRTEEWLDDKLIKSTKL